jgi:ABC-type lipoprotein release transport system permease subunit
MPSGQSVLSPIIYLRRNLRRIFPTLMVIMLAVTLVCSIVTIVGTIDKTVYTLYGYNRYLTGLTPRNSLQVDSVELDKIRALPELGKLFNAHSYQTQVKTIFGKMPFPIFGLEPEARQMLMERCRVRLKAGRLVEEGKPECVLSADVAQNLGLKIGDTVCYPESEDSYAPLPVKLVGVLDGPVWIGITSKLLVDTYSPLTWSGYLAFAPDRSAAAQTRLDDAIERVVTKGKARVWRFSGLVKETRSALANLYLILNIVITIIVISISFVCGLLSSIYFTQRLPEIATLSAIGYPRSRLLNRAAWETVLLCIAGWILGSAFTVTLLWIVRETVMAPRGLILEPFDPRALLFTLPLPVAIGIFAIATIALRLASLDPVSIIERR